MLSGDLGVLGVVGGETFRRCLDRQNVTIGANDPAGATAARKGGGYESVPTAHHDCDVILLYANVRCQQKSGRVGPAMRKYTGLCGDSDATVWRIDRYDLPTSIGVFGHRSSLSGKMRDVL